MMALMRDPSRKALGNGANDNFKGFATVWGSQTLSYRSALLR